MRTENVLVVAFVTVGLGFMALGCHRPSAVAPLNPNGPVEVVIPEHGAYTGAFMDFGDEEDDVTLEAIEDFERQNLLPRKRWPAAIQRCCSWEKPALARS